MRTESAYSRANSIPFRTRRRPSHFRARPALESLEIRTPLTISSSPLANAIALPAASSSVLTFTSFDQFLPRYGGSGSSGNFIPPQIKHAYGIDLV